MAILLSLPVEAQWIIAGMELPTGMVSYHLHEKYWLFLNRAVKTLEKAPPWDGYTPEDVVNRLAAWAAAGVSA